MSICLLLILLSIMSLAASYHLSLRPIARCMKRSVRCYSVWNGDSTSPVIYDKIFSNSADNRADILITDPPYCLLTRRRKGGDLRDPKFRVRKLDDQPTVPRFENIAEYRRFTESWLSNCVQRALKPNAPLIIWTNALGKAPITTVAESYGYKCIGEYLWAKRTVDNIKENSTKNEILLRVYESALIFLAKPEAELFISQQSQLNADKSPITWSVISGYHENEEVHAHPCHKPFVVNDPLIRQWSKPDDIVLDVFAGSGGILTSAKKLQRKVIGIEKIDEWATYCVQKLG